MNYLQNKIIIPTQSLSLACTILTLLILKIIF